MRTFYKEAIMKNKTQGVIQRYQDKFLDWLCKEVDEDDFLLGKIPREFNGIEEEEE